MYLFLPTVRLRNRLKQMTFSLLNRRWITICRVHKECQPAFRVGTTKGTLRY